MCVCVCVCSARPSRRVAEAWGTVMPAAAQLSNCALWDLPKVLLANAILGARRPQQRQRQT